MIRIIRWRDFQHYHNRRVPWVKLYAWLLNDREYRALPKDARALLNDLWLLASETLDGVLQLSPEDIAWRLRDDPGEVRRLLTTIAASCDANGPKWLELDAGSSVNLAAVYQQSMPEGEGEGEKRENIKAEQPKPNPDVVAVLETYQSLHPTRKPFDPHGVPKAPAARAVKKALGWGFTVADLQAALKANAADPWHREKRKHELEYVLRTEDKVRGWVEKSAAEDADEGVYAGITFVN